MRTYKTIKLLKEINVPELIICDVCKKQIEHNDYIETQEMTTIHFTGGYGSVFGDGAEIELDICQSCLKEKLGEYLRIEGESRPTEPQHAV
jgi:protein-arginine kinase activator protein McsA